MSPTILFLLHGQILRRGFAQARAAWGSWRAALFAVGAFLLAPVWLFTQASLDRDALHRAMDFVYQPQLYPRQSPTVNPQRVCRTLLKLNDSQSGLYLPLLTGFYNWRVFDNLQLSDKKLAELYFTFSGKKLPEPTADKSNMGGIFGRSNRSRQRGGGNPVQFKSDLVKLESLTVSARDDGDCQRSVAVLKIHNQTAEQNEYVAKFRLSPAVMVSGLWLHINGERVPGQLFEKSTALWVYQRIRNQRRDPALLRYTANDELELRVFPLEGNQTRIVEIEFLYPKNFQHTILFDGKNILPANGEPVQSFIVTNFSDRQALLLADYHKLPRVTQNSYAHYIVTRSADAKKFTAAELLKKLNLPEFSECKVTLANYESRPLMTSPVPVANLGKIINDEVLSAFPPRGGFLEDKVIGEEILDYANSLKYDEPNSFLQYPVFVIHPFGKSAWQPNETTAALLASCGGSSLYAFNNSFYNFTNDFPPEGKQQRQVVIVATNKQQVCVFAESSRAIVPANGELEIYDANSEKFTPISKAVISVVENKTYKLGAEALALQDEIYHHPQRAGELLPQLAKLSKQSGIMVPMTSYIVVENSMQWKLLSQKEKEKLADHQALEIEAVPEPGVIWLLASGLLILLLHRLFKPRINTSQGKLS